MKTATYIKLDTDVKKQAQALAEELGFSLSSVINAQLKNFVRQQNFTVSKVPQMSDWLENELAIIEEDIKEGKNIVGSASTPEELDAFFAKL